jgi:ubiquinone/menaquinone biosynthesis C-methylase UbiE
VDRGAYTLGHYLLGIEGLALLRGRGDDGRSPRRRLDEIRLILDGIGNEPFSSSRDVEPIDTLTGYDTWAATYDRPGNVTVELEQSVVWEMLDALPPDSLVLDAGCGTGRHTLRLVQLGHRVIGVDASESMLDRARQKLPDATFLVGDITAIPLEQSAVDAAVCALALSHAARLEPALAELARVVRSGGRLIVSNPHPFATAYLNWRATVDAEDGGRAVITEHPHTHAESIRAFREVGFEVLACVEPTLSRELAAAEAKAGLEDAFRAALTGIPVVVVWLLERRQT